MKRTHIVRIQCTLEIPYDRNTFGETTKAEATALRLKQCMEDEKTAVVSKWTAKHTSVEVE